jgi:hypothetical protein
MRGASRDWLQLARELAGKNHAFCPRADTSHSARSLKALAHRGPQATFSP